MAFDEDLAARIRQALGPRTDVTERKMFGGLAFLLNGKMLCGIVRSDLMVKVGAEQHRAALEEPYARPMDFTGRPMKGFVFVSEEGFATSAALQTWLARGLNVASSTQSAELESRRAKPEQERRRQPR